MAIPLSALLLFPVKDFGLEEAEAQGAICKVLDSQE
jgi:hypothetical protein